MTRKILTVLSATAVTFALWGTGCGGESAPTGVNSATAVSSGAPVPKDATADAAATFCKHERDKSAVQPPDLLSKKQIMSCLTAIRQVLNVDCAKSPDEREVVVKIIIEKSGRVSDSFPVGASADLPEAMCVAEKVKGVEFPLFKGSTQQVIEKFPFTLAKPAQ